MIVLSAKNADGTNALAYPFTGERKKYAFLAVLAFVYVHGGLYLLILMPFSGLGLLSAAIWVVDISLYVLAFFYFWVYLFIVTLKIMTTLRIERRSTHEIGG